MKYPVQPNSSQQCCKNDDKCQTGDPNHCQRYSSSEFVLSFAVYLAHGGGIISRGFSYRLEQVERGLVRKSKPWTKQCAQKKNSKHQSCKA